MSDETGAVAPVEPVPAQVNAVEEVVTATPEEKPVTRTFTQDELDEIVEKRLAKAERKAARERERLMEKVLERDKPAKEPEPQASVDNGPRRQDFDDYEQYIEARAEWKADQKFAERERKQAAEEARKQAESKAESWQKRVKDATKEIEDLDEVLEISDAPMTRAMADAITESDIGPRLAYHLAKHPDEAARIANLSPIAQVREITKLEVSLSAEPQPRKKTSEAPEPITPVGGKASAASDSPSDRDSVDDWMRKRNAQLRRG